jgi:hypothetical protein
MHVVRYRTDLPALVAALTASELLARYQAAAAAELESLADQAQVRHVRRMVGLAAAAQGGFDRVARRDPAAADALLTELFTVASWHGWELPVTALEPAEVDVDDLPRGLLGADPGNGAGLWQLDATTIGLARSLTADATADHGHWQRH